MIWIYLSALFLLTAIGGSVPLFLKGFRNSWMTLMLAFSGSFLLGITLLHLMPETFHELNEKAGLYILLGFFPIFIGLSVHAFMEGIPLGFNYQSAATLPSIFIGVAAHKLPEAITLCSLLIITQAYKNKGLVLLLFAAVSPISAMLAMVYGQKFYFISSILVYIIPLVIGSFLHISTTVLYESGTRHHELSRQKVLAVILGLGSALATLVFHTH
jgi:zinc transporter ZupT